MSDAPAHIEADVLVIGAGGAGMYAALAAVEAGAERIVLADHNMVGRGGAMVMARMTVAAAPGAAKSDSVEEHLEDDALEAGCGLCDRHLCQLTTWFPARGDTPAHHPAYAANSFTQPGLSESRWRRGIERVDSAT